MRIHLFIASLGIALLAGCGKQPPSPPSPPAGPAVAAPGKPAPAAVPSEPPEDPKEARALELYEKWEAAKKVKLSAQDIAELPAHAAESARKHGEVLDLEILSGHDANPDLFLKTFQIARKQLDAFHEDLAKEPKEIQDIFRSLLAGRGVRNPVLLDDSRVAFETDSNTYDTSDADPHSDIYFWFLDSGSVQYKSGGAGVDGDWACLESSVAASGNAFVFERQFKGPLGKVQKEPFPGIVWFGDASALSPVSTLETWTPEGGFVPLKEGDKRFFRRPAISGDGRRIALIAYFSPSEDDRRGYGDVPADELVLMDRDTKQCRALSARAGTLGPHAISRDGNVVAVVGPPVAFEKGSTDSKPALFRIPTDGSPPKRIVLPEGVTPELTDRARPAISADGSRIVFEARADKAPQLYLYDHASGAVTLVSATPTGAPGNGGSYKASISADGKWIAFTTEANDLVAAGSKYQICVRDVAKGETSIGSVNPEGQPCHGVCDSPSLNSDGSLLAFLTTAEDLPGVRKPKKPRPGPTPSRLFVVRLKDRQHVLLGNALKP